jgi:hypothetical protein
MAERPVVWIQLTVAPHGGGPPMAHRDTILIVTNPPDSFERDPDSG